jgi:hypothetical protein
MSCSLFEYTELLVERGLLPLLVVEVGGALGHVEHHLGVKRQRGLEGWPIYAEHSISTLGGRGSAHALCMRLQTPCIPMRKNMSAWAHLLDFCLVRLTQALHARLCVGEDGAVVQRDHGGRSPRGTCMRHGGRSVASLLVPASTSTSTRTGALLLVSGEGRSGRM